MTDTRLRVNKEYFGYLVGFPSGEIFLLGSDAEPALTNPNITPTDVSRFLLKELAVKPSFYLETPPLIWLEITRRCNLRCPHCYIYGGEARANELDDMEVLQILDDIAEMGVWAVAFTGGEPTLHPSFSHFVNHAHDRGLLVGIATNGMFLTHALLDSLPRDGVIISVSWDDLHLGDGKRAVDFRIAGDAVLRAQRFGFLTNLMTNSHRFNTTRLKDIIDWAETHDVSVRSVPFSPLGRGKKHRELENSVDDVEQAAQFWLRECTWEHEYHKKAGLCVGVIFNYGLSLAYMTRRCSSGRYLAYIAADGTVYPCTMCAGEEIFSPGNIRLQRFPALWHTDWEIREFSWHRFEKTCEGCPVNDSLYYCAARCPAMSFARHRDFTSCGASDFEKLSTLVRTGLIQQTETGRTTGLPT